MKLSDLLPYLLHKFSSESDLVRAIEEISQKFTVERKNINDYLNDERLVSAYTAFYLTTNIPKFEGVLPWLPDAWKEDIKDCDLIDLGAGPGTMSIAFKEWSKGSGKIYQIETSKFMREQGRKIWDGLYPDTPLIQATSWTEKNDRPKFVIFGHSANEMGSHLVMDYLDRIKADHILFIEPGTKEFFPRMLEIREELLRQKYEVVFPCPASMDCPMKSTEDWCHQFINVRHDPDVERLTQLAKKDRKLLPITVHLYSKKSYEKSLERVVRVLPETKFSLEWEVCAENNLEHYQIMRRGLDKSQQKTLENTLSGTGITTDLEKKVDQIKRVKIKKLNFNDF